MQRQSTDLTGVLLAFQLVGKVATDVGLTVSQLRTLGLVAALRDDERVVRPGDVAKVLGLASTIDVRKDGLELVRAGLLERYKHRKTYVGWRVLPAGRVVLAQLEREERAARRRVSGVELKRWPGKYVRSAAWYAARGKVPPSGVAGPASP